MADLDRLLREQNPEPGQPRVPVPQYQRVDGVGFERVTGRHGGAHSVLLGPDGRPISSSNPMPVKPANALFGATVADRPAANTVPVGTTFTLTNSDLDTWISNGTNWVEV